MLQWSSRQVHDTVAAIASQPEFGGGRAQSLLGRFVRFLARKFSDILDWVRGSVDARLIVVVTVVALAAIVAARVIAERRAAEARRARAGRQAGRRRRDPWAESRELASEGRYTDASHLLYAALVDAMAAQGLVRYHASKTSGDYSRELRRANAPIATEFRAFGRAFERAAFGTSEITREEYEGLAIGAERLAQSVGHRSAA